MSDPVVSPVQGTQARLLAKHQLADVLPSGVLCTCGVELAALNAPLDDHAVAGEPLALAVHQLQELQARSQVPEEDIETGLSAVWVRFYFSDADPVAECECGWRTVGDAAVDAFRAWWKHRASHDHAAPTASTSGGEAVETAGLVRYAEPYPVSEHQHDGTCEAWWYGDWCGDWCCTRARGHGGRHEAGLGVIGEAHPAIAASWPVAGSPEHEGEDEQLVQHVAAELLDAEWLDGAFVRRHTRDHYTANCPLCRPDYGNNTQRIVRTVLAAARRASS